VAVRETGKIEYIVGDENIVDRCGPLWEKLNQHHIKRSVDFAAAYARRRWADRRDGMLLAKLQNDSKLRVDLAVRDGREVGYCIATVSAALVGEIESIYVEEARRGQGVGRVLMEKALGWFEAEGIRHRMIGVGAGNEEVLPFYARFGFVPSATVLRHKDSFG
jgi:diamine N-acetyltransferase